MIEYSPLRAESSSHVLLLLVMLVNLLSFCFRIILTHNKRAHRVRTNSNTIRIPPPMIPPTIPPIIPGPTVVGELKYK